MTDQAPPPDLKCIKEKCRYFGKYVLKGPIPVNSANVVYIDEPFVMCQAIKYFRVVREIPKCTDCKPK